MCRPPQKDGNSAYNLQVETGEGLCINLPLNRAAYNAIVGEQLFLNNAINGIMPLLLQQPQMLGSTAINITLLIFNRTNLNIIMAKKKSTTTKGTAKKRARVPKGTTKVARRSRRQNTLKNNKEAQVDHIDNGVLFIDKTRDGFEEKRKEKSLQVLAEREGPMLFEVIPKGLILSRVNHRRRLSQAGKEPCYDVMDGQGSSIYAYSLPTTLMAGLLQGLKSVDAVATFKKETTTLQSHAATNYMFLHWLGEKEELSDGNDYKMHSFCKVRPGLVTTIESLGNMVSRKILFHTAIGAAKYPGVLSNRTVLNGVEQDFQEPHWDFYGWRGIKADEMPWIVHVPLCREGMMLHVWPTQRDLGTHALEAEKLKLGTPRLVYVAFGDYLLLRADVCHGGCFGSKGNMRFHMVLRKKDCPLETKRLHLLYESGIDKEDFKKKSVELSKKLGLRHTCFETERTKKNKTVAAYMKALKNVYPQNDTWTDGLLDNLTYC